VIQDADNSLKALLVQKVPIDITAIDIRFEIPTKEWSATVTKPTINLFLYDVRENHELRSQQRLLSAVTGTAGSGAAGSGTDSGPPVRMDLCYMITVWTADVSDEHQLLGSLLTTLLRFPILPPEVLSGSMATQPFPLRAWIAQPERTPNPWDFWGNVEHRMKAGLNFTVTVAVQPFADATVQLVTQPVVTIQPLPPQI
jgi:hypothetical protein